MFDAPHIGDAVSIGKRRVFEAREIDAGWNEKHLMRKLRKCFLGERLRNGDDGICAREEHAQENALIDSNKEVRKELSLAHAARVIGKHYRRGPSCSRSDVGQIWHWRVDMHDARRVGGKNLSDAAIPEWVYRRVGNEKQYGYTINSQTIETNFPE